jgi:S1-C subfamily serine protease
MEDCRGMGNGWDSKDASDPFADTFDEGLEQSDATNHDPFEEIPTTGTEASDPFFDSSDTVARRSSSTSPRIPRIHRLRIPRWILLSGVAIVLVLLTVPRLIGDGSSTDWDRLTRSIVLLSAPDCGWVGSGTLVLRGDHVLTNAHVAFDERGQPCDLEVYAAKSPDVDPEWIAFAVPIPQASDLVHDLAVVRLIDRHGDPVSIEDRWSITISDQELAIGDRIKVFGFPGMGGRKITITPGEQAGWWTGQGDGWEGDFYKTSAKMGPGVSGGAAFAESSGAFIGIPTGGSDREATEGGDVLGLIRPSSYAVPLIEKAATIIDR